jgi:hypothetical protein
MGERCRSMTTPSTAPQRLVLKSTLCWLVTLPLWGTRGQHRVGGRAEERQDAEDGQPEEPFDEATYD